MNYVYDIILLLLFVSIVYSGWRQGVLSVVMRLLGWIVAVTLIVSFSADWAASVYHSVVEARVEQAVSAAIPADAIAAMNDGAEAMQSLQAALDSLGGIMGGQNVSAAQADSIISLFQQDAGSLAQLVTQTILEPVLINAVRIVLSVAIVLACLIAFRLLARMVRARRGRGGVLNRTNHFLGGVLGVGEGLLSAYIYVMVLAILAEAVNGPRLSPGVLSDTVFVRLFI